MLTEETHVCLDDCEIYLILLTGRAVEATSLSKYFWYVCQSVSGTYMLGCEKDIVIMRGVIGLQTSSFQRIAQQVNYDNRNYEVIYYITTL